MSAQPERVPSASSLVIEKARPLFDQFMAATERRGALGRSDGIARIAAIKRALGWPESGVSLEKAFDYTEDELVSRLG